MSSSGESGLQLLGRLKSRPTLNGLDKVLFPDGLNSNEVIEITGDTNCGKTLLLTRLIMKCIMPKSWNSILIDGLDSSVILINTDHHFQIFKLTELMEQHLNCCTTNLINNDTNEVFNSNSKETIIKYSLSNLIILNIHNSYQFQVTMHSLKQLVPDNPKINLILLDSISSYYWQDVHTSFCGNVRKMDMYANKLLKSLQKYIVDFNVSLIYTRPSFFKSASRQFDDVHSDCRLGNINRRICLLNFQLLKNNKKCYQCIVSTSSLKFVKYYTIEATGFKWMFYKSESSESEK